MKIFTLGAVAFILALSMPQTLLAQPREIDIAADEEWVHPHNGLQVPAHLGEIKRSQAYSYADNFLDIGFAYDTPDQALTLYIFRATNGSASIWFDQAEASVLGRDMYDGAVRLGPVRTFAPSGTSAASGLKAVYQPGEKSQFKSTGLAFFPVGNWYVKLRASSMTRSPDELVAWMDKSIAEIALPDGIEDGQPAAPIVPCPTKLKYNDNTKDVKHDLAEDMVAGMLGGLSNPRMKTKMMEILEAERGEIQNKPKPRLVTYCRDSRIDATIGAYRDEESDKSYLLAVGDNGRAANVAPDFAGSILGKRGSGKQYSITFITADRNLILPSQNRFPSPERVLEILDKGHVRSSVSTWGDDTSIQLSAPE